MHDLRMSNRIDQLHAVNPHQALARAVLKQAIDDAVNGETHYCGDLEIAEARAFLTAPGGKWRVSRRLWCDQAGIDPDYFERRMAALLRAT